MHIIMFVGIHHFTDSRIILKSLVLVNVAMSYKIPQCRKFIN